MAEYTGHEQIENSLTALLHIKENTEELLISDLEMSFKAMFSDLSELSLTNKDKKVVDLILEKAKELSNEVIECLDLEKKIVLSIGIRLLAEKIYDT